MAFNNYLIESTILYESIKQYNTLTEATEEAFIPPTWAVEFTKHEKDKGEFSKSIVKETVRLENKSSFSRVIRDAISDPVKGFIIMNEDVPLFAAIKDPKDSGSVLIMAIDPAPAKKLHRPDWKNYTAHDAKYYDAHNKYSGKKTTDAAKAIEELLCIFVANFVKGENDTVELNDALSLIKISAKTIEIETDHEKADKAKRDNDNESSTSDSGPRDPHDHPAVKVFSKDYLEKYIKDTVTTINKNVPTITKAENLAHDAVNGRFNKINIDDIVTRLEHINDIIEKFGAEYKDKKRDSDVTSDPDWEKKFAADFAKSLRRTTTTT